MRARIARSNREHKPDARHKELHVFTELARSDLDHLRTTGSYPEYVEINQINEPALAESICHLGALTERMQLELDVA